MELAADLTRRLDGLEGELPPAAAKVLHLQRSAVSSVTHAAGDAFSAVTEVASSVVGAARNGVRTVLGQARSGVATTGEVGRTQARTVTGQAGAQADRLAQVASKAVEDLADRGIDRLEDSGSGSGRAYEHWTRAELLSRAREVGIDGRTRMSKPQLIRALRAD